MIAAPKHRHVLTYVAKKDFTAQETTLKPNQLKNMANPLEIIKIMANLKKAVELPAIRATYLDDP